MLVNPCHSVRNYFKNQPNKTGLTVFGRLKQNHQLCTIKTETMKNDTTNLYKMTLGNPSIGCRRYGICSIEESDYRMIPTELPHNTAWATIEIKRNTLIFRFLRATMTETTFKTHFSNGFFRIEKPINWQDKGISIGIYPIQVFENKLIIKIPPSVFRDFEELQNNKYFQPTRR